jgi:3-hydroxymyristoyl/3-hydroxydecanoyl-(acyl carrier protein) dehydratase
MIEKIFPADHPALAGHFPGNPIVPGAVLLGETAFAIEASGVAAPGMLRLRSAKFLRPVRPGDRVSIRFDRDVDGGVRFTCDVRGETVLTGQMTCSDPPTTN